MLESMKTSFKYTDGDRTPGGVQQLQLIEGLKVGKSAQWLKGKGVDLDLPVLPLPYVAFPLTAQLQGSHGLCFETNLGALKRTTAGKLDVRN